MSGAPKKVVLAYSGGLDTSVIMAWIRDTYGCDVVAFTADIGQGQELDGLEAKALKTGASKVYIDDLRDEFVRDFVFPAFRAGAVYEHDYLMGTSLARPLIAKRMVEIARLEGADAVAHGATGKGNDQVRFELTAYALEPGIKIIAPWREWTFKSRTDLIEYAESKGIPVPVTKSKPYSTDRNLLHISYEGGILEDPWQPATEEMYTLSVPPEKAPDTAAEVTLSFESGDPVAIDGEPLWPADMLARLNELGGANGIGRIDVVENRFVGMKSRGVYETPGGTLLYHAHRALESITLDREVMHIRDSLIPQYARLIYNGFWYSPERQMLQDMIDGMQKPVTGDVRLKLYKGNVYILGRRSPNSLFSEAFATFEKDTVYNQKDAEGFIRLNALRLRIGALTGRAPVLGSDSAGEE